MTIVPEAPRGEFERRHERLRAVLRERNIDGVVLTRPQNIYYLSNFRAAPIAAWTSRFHALAVPSNGNPRLIARQLEAESAAVQWTPEPLLWADHEDPYQLLAETIRRDDGWAGLHRVGIEKQFISVAQHDAFVKAVGAVVPDLELVDISGVVESLAANLSNWERDCMRQAATVTSAGMATALSTTTVGAYPYDVVGSIQQAMYGHGQSDFEKSFVAVWSGPRGGLMHDTRTTRQLADGDVATIEIMGVDHHYTTCAQTSVFIGAGAPTPETTKAYELIIDMHNAARAVLRAGVTAGDVFEAADALYRSATGESYFRRIGGSLGLTLFALDLVKDSTAVIADGTPLLVQILVNEPVLLTCTSTVIVTTTGVEELTAAIVSDQLLGSV